LKIYLSNFLLGPKQSVGPRKLHFMCSVCLFKDD
jgi:hypothetical protein